MMLADLIYGCKLQLRFTPVISDTDIVTWLRQAILEVCNNSLLLEKIVPIVCKENVNVYLLPGDHIVTSLLFYNKVRLQRATAFDAQLVGPTTPVYYYEDNWQDDASVAPREFIKHYMLQKNYWLLQLCRSQIPWGRKTVTILAAPIIDGTVNGAGFYHTGAIDGLIDDKTIMFEDTFGLTVTIISFDNNLVLLYKFTDVLPELATDEIQYHDFMSLLYKCKTLSLALNTEDDEFDRYRSWLYDYMAYSVCTLLKGMTINKRLV